MRTVEVELGSIFGGGPRTLPKEVSRPLAEAQIMELRELLKAESAPNPFKVGDLVTPKKSSPYVLEGQPHIVIEVLDPPIRPTHDTSGPDGGAPHDLRVGAIDRAGGKSVYLMRSVHLEAYTEPDAS